MLIVVIARIMCLVAGVNLIAVAAQPGTQLLASFFGGLLLGLFCIFNDILVDDKVRGVRYNGLGS